MVWQHFPISLLLPQFKWNSTKITSFLQDNKTLIKRHCHFRNHCNSKFPALQSKQSFIPTPKLSSSISLHNGQALAVGEKWVTHHCFFYAPPCPAGVNHQPQLSRLCFFWCLYIRVAFIWTTGLILINIALLTFIMTFLRTFHLYRV